MSSTDTNVNRREIEVEIPADVVARESDAVVQKLQKMARLPGFRRGKVPPAVIRSRFAEDIRSEIVESLVPKYFHKAAEKQGLVPVSAPRVSDLRIQDGEPLRFRATFEVLPAIEVAGYRDLRTEHPDVTVTDDEVQQSLDNIREQHATYIPVEDRELREGDHAQVSLNGTPTDTAPQAGSQPVAVEDVLVEIGGKNTMPEFTENLRGVRPGEERTFTVTYPPDFSDQRLAGKTFRYNVQVKAIKQKQLLDWNDDLAREVGSFETLDELKQKVRESLEQDRKHQAEHEVKDKIVEELVRRFPFEVPESLVERQIDVRLERGLRALAAQGMKPEDMKRLDFARLRAGQKEAAEREVKASLLLEKIADTEEIQVSDEEVDHEVQALAEQAKQPLEAVRERLTRDGAVARIRNRIRSEKTLEFLYSKSA